MSIFDCCRSHTPPPPPARPADFSAIGDAASTASAGAAGGGQRVDLSFDVKMQPQPNPFSAAGKADTMRLAHLVVEEQAARTQLHLGEIELRPIASPPQAPHIESYTATFALRVDVAGSQAAAAAQLPPADSTAFPWMTPLEFLAKRSPQTAPENAGSAGAAAAEIFSYSDYVDSRGPTSLQEPLPNPSPLLFLASRNALTVMQSPASAGSAAAAAAQPLSQGSPAPFQTDSGMQPPATSAMGSLMRLAPPPTLEEFMRSKPVSMQRPTPSLSYPPPFLVVESDDEEENGPPAYSMATPPVPPPNPSAAVAAATLPPSPDPHYVYEGPYLVDENG